MPATAPTTLAADDVQPGVAPPKQGEERPRGRPLRARPALGLTRLAPSGQIQTQCCPPPRGQSRRSANWRTKLVGRQSLLCRACRGSSPFAQPKSGPPKKAPPALSEADSPILPYSKPPLPGIALCALPGDQQAPPTDLSNTEATIPGTDPVQLQGRDPRGADFAHALQPLGFPTRPVRLPWRQRLWTRARGRARTSGRSTTRSVPPCSRRKQRDSG